MAPQLILELFDGSRFELSQQKGKVVMLHFWNPSTEEARASIPRLQTGYETLRKRYERFEMITLSLDRVETAALELHRSQPFPWPNGWTGHDSSNAGRYGVEKGPAFFLVGPDGRILLTPESGEWPRVEEVIRAVLAK
jgi:hypothetical protein